ncbi:VWA domain-containing protein [Robertmurraya korlensis]|uniref:VWA domain-containing protein n=1 Tax=Robertmurraya korlensis TaxID=519977 RepID=UPI001E3B7E96|nr:VWA domain-containing protein [Robertmurraya korlensis]
MFKRFFLILVIISFAVACSNKEQTMQKEKSNKEEEKEVVKLVTYPEQPTLAEEMVQQPAGIHSEDLYASLEGSNVDSELPMGSAIEDLVVQDLKAEEIYNGLIHYLGADYSLVFDSLKNFIPDYGAYDLSKEQPSLKNVAIHLDSSGSMNAQVSGGVKMDLAKRAIATYASGLPATSKVSLRVYGHRGTGSDNDKAKSCSSTEIMYNTHTYEQASFEQALTKFKPSGWTPLAASIANAYEDLKKSADDKSENILFVVSDGIETCNGNPVEEARKLANSDLKVKVNIIGFDVDDAGQKQLKETALAGKGTYYTVNSNVELNDTIQELLQEARTTYERNFEIAKIGYKINMKKVEIGQGIEDLGSSFMDVTDAEKDVLFEAVTRLEDQKEITPEMGEELRTIIDDRHIAIREYINQLEDEAREKNNTKHQEVISGLK